MVDSILKMFPPLSPPTVIQSNISLSTAYEATLQVELRLLLNQSAVAAIETKHGGSHTTLSFGFVDF